MNRHKHDFMICTTHLMVLFVSQAAALAQDQITVSAPIGGLPQLWVDADPIMPGMQRCRRVSSPPGSTFAVDIYAYNILETQPLFCARVDLWYDSRYVSPVLGPPGVSDHSFFEFGSLYQPTTFPLGRVRVLLDNEPDFSPPYSHCGTGPSGDFLMARVHFNVIMEGQTGIDIADPPTVPCSSGSGTCLGWTYPPPGACCPDLCWYGPETINGRALIVIDPTETLSCLNVNMTADAARVSTSGDPRSPGPLGLGDVTLRSAIQLANLLTGDNRITFRIPQTNPTITLGSPLPALSDASGGTHIDGTTQTLGMAHVAGAVAGGSPTFALSSASNTIQRLAIVGNATGNGVAISASNNKVIGCRVGSSNQYEEADPNLNGIVITAGSGNQIGGIAAGEGNVISGNSSFGVLLSGGAGTLVRGNKIGTNNTGMAAVPNGAGVRIESSSGHTIGGLETAARNIISGNSPAGGIEIIGNSQYNLVQGNIIGLDRLGTTALPNATDGVWIGGAANNTIGGTVAEARNFISGNDQFGVQITGPSATGNVVQGNFIGPDVNATAPLVNSNGFDGVVIDEAPANIIGGSIAAARNIISANGRHGVAISGANATQNEIKGNYIGMDDMGTTGLGNSGDGVNVDYGAHGNLIGGLFTGDGNVISRNVRHGVNITGNASTSNLVQGNLIGTDVTGTTAQGNVVHGVLISDAPNNIIGGSIPAMRNVISDNGQDGVHITGLDATGTIVQNNFIGTTITGNTMLGNTDDGVEIDGIAGGALIGGVVGLTPAGNLISGNGGAGVHIKQCTNTSSPQNAVQANIIGLNLARTSGIPNGRGVIIEDGSEYNIIGGSDPSQANVISGNTGDGVLLWGNVLVGIRYNTVMGNIIGTTEFDPSPPIPNTLPLRNGGDGVNIDAAASENYVGQNSIRGNGGYGVHIKSPNTDRNEIRQNTIGYNLLGGVLIDAGAQWNGIGDNNIQSNTGCGVVIDGLNTDENTVAGNIIRANATEGVMILNLASANFIGVVGPGGAVGNQITSNNGDGVFILSPANFVMANNITGNGANGVRVASSAIRIQQNTMADNVLLGIELEGASNNSQPAPQLTSAGGSAGGGTVSGSITSTPGTYTLEFFASAACDPSGYGEGQTFLGSTALTVGPTGSATFSASVSGSFAGANSVTATATDSSNNTSEFSACQPIGSDPPTCPADNAPPGGDGVVNVNDLLAVISAWGACTGCPADITGDGVVNVNDLLAVINAWGMCP